MFMYLYQTPIWNVCALDYSKLKKKLIQEFQKVFFLMLMTFYLILHLVKIMNFSSDRDKSGYALHQTLPSIGCVFSVSHNQTVLIFTALIKLPIQFKDLLESVIRIVILCVNEKSEYFHPPGS